MPTGPSLPAFMRSPFANVQNPFTNVTNSFIQGYTSAYQYVQAQTGNAIYSAMTALQVAQVNGQSTYNWEEAKTREARNIHRNWTKSLEETIRHVCEIAKRAIGGSVRGKVDIVDFKRIEEAGKYGLTVK